MSSIQIAKIKRNSKIILETPRNIFEIIVTGPKGCSAMVIGSPTFINHTKCTITKTICKGRPVEFEYTDVKTQKKKVVKTGNVISATVYAYDESWKYDVIEKDEDTNTT